MQETASIGAEITAVLWGCFHVQIQGLIACIEDDKQNALLIALGGLIPSASIANTQLFPGLGFSNQDATEQRIAITIPALYWRGIDTQYWGFLEVCQ